MIQLKTLNKRTATRSQGVFYKSIVNDEEKEVTEVLLSSSTYIGNIKI